MKSLVLLWTKLAEELASWCRTSTALDAKTVECRVEDEGLSFLTITLPAFGKSFELCLENGKVDYADFPGFRRGKTRGPLPLFLGGFLSRVFDPGSGEVLPDPDPESVFAVRQLTLMFGKMELPCTEFRIRKALRQYVETDREVQEAAQDLTEDSRREFRRVAALLFSDVLVSVDRMVAEHELRGRHGPGATAERLSANGRIQLNYWPQRLERCFPYGEYALPSWRYYYQLDRVDFPEPEAELPVRVITVPKTLKTPRIIAIEPASMQYMQQAVLEPLVQLLEAKRVPGNSRDNLCQGMIGFSDQKPNRDLALLGSINRNFATLDLSEASDRVSTLHVSDLLHYWPSLQEAVMATRSLKARVPGHGVIPLSKFASMGSALCFPMEAMIFLTIVFLGIQDVQNSRLSRKDINSFRGRVRVYGDDIIVPVDYVHAVVARLESFGFKVNSNKSFWIGKFRESCGGDYFDGYDVTPTRLKHLIPNNRTDASGVQGLVAFRNNLYLRGLWRTAAYLDEIVRKVLPHYPTVLSTSPLLGRLSFLGYQAERTHPDIHIPLVKGYYVRPRIPADRLDDWPVLLKFFNRRGDNPLPMDHLQRQGRPQAVDIKLGWKAPY